MAEQHQGVWGIDIGQCALKAIRLEMIDGQITATAFDYVEHPKILSQPDADPDALTREALEKFLSRNTLKGDRVAISVPGQSGLARFVKLPPVEEKKIPDIVRFEAKQQIPFPLDEVVWDFQKIGAGTVTDGFAMETEIGLFALKRDMINRYLQHFKDIHVEVHIVQMSPLALCNFVSSDLLHRDAMPATPAPAADGEAVEEKKAPSRGAIVALDIGTDNSNLVVTDGDRIIWQRPIPFGGNHFTRALSKDLKMTFAKAEHLKRNATKSPELKKILAALKPVLNDFVGEVQRSLGYFTNTHRNAQIEYMVGLGNAFRLPGLQKFLSEKLQLDVRKLSTFERLGGESVTGASLFTQNIMSFPTAYGLALQGLQLARLQTNLLPPEIQFERMIRAKKPWAVTAAAAMLVGVMAMTFKYSMEYQAVAAASVQQAIEEGTKVKSQIDQNNSQFDTKSKEVQAKIDAARRITAGQSEHLDWVVLNEFVDDCIPVPGALLRGKFKTENPRDFIVIDSDGKDHTFVTADSLVLVNEAPTKVSTLKKNAEVVVIYNDHLNDKSRQYWNEDAQLAFYKYWQRQASGRGTETRAEDEAVEHLIQVNIDSILPLYSNNLTHYIEKLKANPKSQELKGMTENDKKTPPQGAGWVVELRGHTYHDKQALFVIDTLVDTLGTRSAGGPPAESASLRNSVHKPDPKLIAEYWGRCVQNKVSHAVLYDYNATKGKILGYLPYPTVVANMVVPPAPINLLSSLIIGTGAPTVTGGGQAAARPSAPPGPSGPARIRPGRPPANPDEEGGGELKPAAQPAPGAPSGTPAQPLPFTIVQASGVPRTDFIILFVWREPTPTF